MALVVAHPDDEVIGAGAMLPLFRNLILVHVTDGAPRNLADAHAHGFTDASSYAAARRQELATALALLPSAPPPLEGGGRGEGCRTVVYKAAEATRTDIEFGASDQRASHQLVPLTRVLRATLATHHVTAIITHPYEGGHPDHDATAFIAAHTDRPVIEFAGYHAAPNGGIQTNAFLPGPEPIRMVLTPDEQARKRAMYAAFKTQVATLASFGTTYEVFRRAPRYDFTHPPHTGTLHYERYDWGMTGERWRSLAAEAHRVLC